MKRNRPVLIAPEPPCPRDGTGGWNRRVTIRVPFWGGGVAYAVTHCKSCLDITKVVPLRLDIWFKVLFGETF